LSRDADAAAIKAAYRAAVLKHHPDKGGSDARFKAIKDAYEVLNNSATRAEYDKELAARSSDPSKSPPPPPPSPTGCAEGKQRQHPAPKTRQSENVWGQRVPDFPDPDFEPIRVPSEPDFTSPARDFFDGDPVARQKYEECANNFAPFPAPESLFRPIPPPPPPLDTEGVPMRGDRAPAPPCELTSYVEFTRAADNHNRRLYYSREATVLERAAVAGALIAPSAIIFARTWLLRGWKSAAVALAVSGGLLAAGLYQISRSAPFVQEYAHHHVLVPPLPLDPTIQAYVSRLDATRRYPTGPLSLTSLAVLKAMYVSQVARAFINPSARIVTGVCACGDEVVVDSIDDRVYSCENNKITATDTLISAYRYYSVERSIFEDGFMSLPMVQALSIKLLPLGAEAAQLQGPVMASRVTTLNIPMQLHVAVQDGSCKLALLECASRPTKIKCEDKQVLIGLCAAMCCAYLLLPRDRRALASLPFHFENCVAAPLIEESFKSTVSTIFNIKRMWVSSLFGLWELSMRVDKKDWRKTPPVCLLPFSLHCALGFVDYLPALCIHATYNTALDLENIGAMMMLPRLALGAAAAVTLFGNALGRSSSNFEDDECSRCMYIVAAKHTDIPQSAVGYHLGDGLSIDFKDRTPPSACGGHIKPKPGFDGSADRKSLQFNLGNIMYGIAPVMPDVNYPPDLAVGISERFLKNPPPIAPALLAEFKAFVTDFVERNFAPIGGDADVSFDTWAAGLDEPAWRIKELRDALTACNGVITEKETRLKGFGKHETYTTSKFSRGINSRLDAFKAFIGPYCKLMEQEVYTDPAFVKHIAHVELPNYIFQRLGDADGPWYETDFSQFEKHFVPELLDACEIVLYRHLLSNHSAACDVLCNAISGTNKISYRGFTVKVNGRRMSGEMVTSLGNGFTNKMVLHFIAHRKGGRCVEVVEGDDGLFHASVPYEVQDFIELGFDAKLEVRQSLFRSGFCGMRMAEDFTTMTDPRKVLLNFGWSHSPLAGKSHRVDRGLLLGKATSLLCEHPQCPIVGPFALSVYRALRRYKARFDRKNYGRKDYLNESFVAKCIALAEKGPTDQARVDFNLLFDIPPVMQRMIESSLRNSSIGVVCDPLVLSLFHDDTYEDCKLYWEKCCVFSGTWGCESRQVDQIASSS